MTDRTSPPTVLEAQQASKVQARELPLLWRRRLPLGMLTVIAGRPGSGKSTAAALIASELSHAGLVSVLSNPEDDVASVVRPRLDALGAKHSLIYLLDEDSLLQLPRDCFELEKMLRELGASLLVLDPISAHFKPERRLHDRNALRQLARVARRTRCAVVGVHHTNKGSGEAIERLGGSLGGLAGSARAVYFFGSDPDNDDRQALSCVKINGTEAPPSLLMERWSVETDDGLEAPYMKIVGHKHHRDPAVVLTKNGYTQPEVKAAAAEWLTIYLAAGEGCSRLRGEIRTEGQRAGFAWTHLQRLAVDLDFLEVDGGTYKKWRLPENHPLRQGDTDG